MKELNPWITIKIKRTTKARIEKHKVHPRQPIDEVMNYCLDQLNGATKKQ